MIFWAAMAVTLALFGLSGWLEWRALRAIARLVQAWLNKSS